MTNEDMKSKLNEAHMLVEEVMGSLNIGSEVCDSCGHKVYENWTHFNSYDALRGATNRIGKVVRWLGGK
jgi:hypothetical protein